MYPACQCQRLRLGVVAHRDRDLQAEFSLKARLPRPGAGETQSVPVTRSLTLQYQCGRGPAARCRRIQQTRKYKNQHTLRELEK